MDICEKKMKRYGQEYSVSERESVEGRREKGVELGAEEKVE